MVVVGNGLDDSGSSDSPYHGMPRELVLFGMSAPDGSRDSGMP